MTILQCSPSRPMLAVLLSIALLAPAPGLVHAQGMTAKIVPKPAPSPELVKLQRKVAALEERVEELEKPDVEVPEDPDEAAKKEARDKAVERRLAALEKAAADAAAKDEADKKKEPAKPDDSEAASAKPPKPTPNNAGKKQPGKPVAKKPTIIFAPFIVVDRSGRTVFRVDAGAAGGTAGVYAPTGGTPRAMMAAEDANGSFNILNIPGETVAAIESGGSGAGRLVITDADATIMVEAGVLKKGIGIVRTGPGGFGPAGVTGGVMPASSIQGRK